MDDKRFDALSRMVGEQSSRRAAVKATVGGALGLLGLRVLDEDALGKGFDGQKCKKNKNCKTGLFCQGSKKKRKKNKGRCRYDDGCGKNGDACRNNDDCCGSRKCRNNNCRND
jgi:hypothetical protein